MTLPRLLLILEHGTAWPAPGREDAGVLLRDVTLELLVELCSAPPLPTVVDVDTVEGLGSDLAAARFLRHRLGVRTAVTRRPVLAEELVEVGIETLLRVNALDSTGVERAIAAFPAGVGTAISPGLVLPHLDPKMRARLPRPLLSYGLIRTRQEVVDSYRAGADSVAVLGTDLAKHAAAR